MKRDDAIATALEDLIRAGRHSEASSRLALLVRKGTSQQLAVTPLANFSWRLGDAERGLRLLRKRIPVDDPGVWSKHPAEGAEYAACLTKLGAVEEAKWILRQEEVTRTAQGPLYAGFAHVETWDYADALPHFERYVRQESLDDYARQVGYANLAATYVYVKRYEEANALLRRLLHDASLAKRGFLLGFVLQTVAVHRISTGDFADAERFLTDAEARWSNVEGLDRFFLEKWRAVIALRRAPDAATKKRLAAVRAHAQSLGAWETIRDLDRHTALAFRDESLFRRVYFGTPFENFRAKLCEEFGVASVEAPYTWTLGDGAHRGTLKLSADGAQVGAKHLDGQGAVLLAILAGDFYRPVRVAALFARLFPNESFRGEVSARRLHEGIRRVNAWLRRVKLPLTAKEADGGYRFAAEGKVTLEVPTPRERERAWQPLEARLAGAFGGRPFSSPEAAAALGMNPRTLLRQLQALVVGGKLQVSGTGKATRYRF